MRARVRALDRARARAERKGEQRGGRERIIRHLRAGDSLGNTALIHDHQCEYTALALEMGMPEPEPELER